MNNCVECEVKRAKLTAKGLLLIGKSEGYIADFLTRYMKAVYFIRVTHTEYGTKRVAVFRERRTAPYTAYQITNWRNSDG